MNDDALLLRRYAEEGSEPAFTQVVRRHVDLVYGAALRRTAGDAHRAADVAQQVFTQLARQARKLSRHPALGAWLHTATRNAALNLMISDQRRQARETEALALDAVQAEGGPDWTELRPLLDAAIDDLPETDRVAVVLRFLERRPFAEIGAVLEVSEDAARMRTERALEKLRTVLARHGIRSTAAALGALVASQPLMSAPLGFGAAVAAQSLAAASAGPVVATSASFMTAKIITTAALSALIAFWAGNYAAANRQVAASPANQVEDSRQTALIESLRNDNQRLKTELTGLTADVARLNEAATQLAELRAAPAPAATPTKKGRTIGMSRGEIQQAVLGNLRQIDAARKQFLHDKGHAPGAVDELVGRAAYIKTVRSVDGEDYSALSMADGALLTATTPDGTSITYDPAGTMTTRPEFTPEEQRLQELGQRSRDPVARAAAAYRAANNGSNPPNAQALLPYFATKEEGADFLELLEAQKSGG